MNGLIEIERDDAPALVFQGELIATAESSPNTAFSNYSGSTGRWTELSLYRVEQSGRFVCVRYHGTQWQGAHSRAEAQAVDGDAEVVEFFGHGRLAKELYREAGIQDAERVE